jgi:hypothetical protein
MGVAVGLLPYYPLLIFSLFNVAWLYSWFKNSFNRSYYPASNVRKINDNELGKMWKEQPLPSLKFYPDIFLEGLRNTLTSISQDRRPPNRGVNPIPPEYEAGRRSSVKLNVVHFTQRRKVEWLWMMGSEGCVKKRSASYPCILRELSWMIWGNPRNFAVGKMGAKSQNRAWDLQKTGAGCAVMGAPGLSKCGGPYQ